MSATILKNSSSCEPYVFQELDQNVCEKLKAARRMYIFHKKLNHSPFRKKALKFWGDLCVSLRGELK